MALAQSMKNFVNELKASRRSRHEFVRGNRETTKNIMTENRKFLKNIHEQNKINAEQTHAFLKSANETRAENYKKSQESIKATLDIVHQSTVAIRRGAHDMLKELQEDNQMAHKYWASLSNDEPVEDPKVATVSKSAKQAGAEGEHSQLLETKSDAKKETDKDEILKIEKEQKNQEESG
jgi:hypothetical protein